MQKRNGLARGLSDLSVRWFEHFLLTFKGGVSFVWTFLLLMFSVFHAVLSVHCSLVATCSERAGLLALLYVMFSCVIVTFPCVVHGQVCYLIVSIPDFCLLLNYIYHELASIKKIYFGMLSTKRRYSNQQTCYI